jgi:hypothetical protein
MNAAVSFVVARGTFSGTFASTVTAARRAARLSDCSGLVTGTATERADLRTVIVTS